MKRNIFILFFTILFLLFSLATISADDTITPEPYTATEFPQWAKDLRRTEIITFGSLPFVNLSTTIVYSFYRYYAHNFSSDYIPNPLASTSDAANLDSNEQITILLTSAGISIGLGLFDFVYNKIKSDNKKIAQYDNSIVITEKNTLKTPAVSGSSQDTSSTQNEQENTINNNYLIGGMESAIF